MRKLLAALIITFFVWSTCSTGYATAAVKTIQVSLDGKIKVLKPKPEKMNGEIIIPVKSIFELFGLQYGYEEKSKSVTGSNKAGNVIIMKIGEKNAEKYGEQLTLKNKPLLFKSIPYISKSDVDLLMDASTKWIEKLSSLNINRRMLSENELFKRSLFGRTTKELNQMLLDYRVTVEQAKILLDQGADINFMEKYGSTLASGKKKNDWPVAEGTFIQKELVRTWDDAKWQSEFQYLKDAGMRYIILAPTAYSERGGPTETTFPSDRFAMEKGYPDLVDNILRNAQKADFKVFLGLNFDGDWWSKSARDPQWLNAKMEQGNLIADELYDKYHGKYPDTFYGWYWVWEVDNLNFTKEKEQRALADAININLQHVKKLNKKMRFMLCPFMNAAFGEPAAYKKMWINVFKLADFRKGDIFAPQDSVGAGGLNMDNFTEWFKVLREAVDTKKGLQFWADAETFDHRDWSSAPLKRFVDQLEGVEPYVDHIITFAYSHYYSPNVGKGAYHQAYVDYVRTGELESVAPSVPGQLTAEADNTATVRVWWAPAQDNTGVVGYKLYRNNVSLSGSLIQPAFYVDRNAAPETEYTYRVSAVDAAGKESERSVGVTVTTPQYRKNLAKGKSYFASLPAHDNYRDTNGTELTDGIRASNTYADAAWQGRSITEPYSITVDLETSKVLTDVSAGFLQDPPVGVTLPQSVVYYVSEDNLSFTKIGEQAKPDNVKGDSQTVEYRLIGLSNVTGRYVKVEVNGAVAWSFIDELEVR